MNLPAIQSADESDGPAILAMLVAAGLPIEDLQDENWRHFWVVRTGAALCAVAGWEHYHHHGLVRSLVVAPDCRGAGLGSALLHAIDKAARNQEVKDLWLLTTTVAAFFSRHGYASVDRSNVPDDIRATREFSELCPDSATVMHRTLAQR